MLDRSQDRWQGCRCIAPGTTQDLLIRLAHLATETRGNPWSHAARRPRHPGTALGLTWPPRLQVAPPVAGEPSRDRPDHLASMAGRHEACQCRGSTRHTKRAVEIAASACTSTVIAHLRRMTRALCLRCGDIKFGALCPCMTCCADADPDRNLAIALSDHYLAVPALERIGQLVRDLAARSPDGDARRSALLLFLAQLGSRYARPVPEAIAPRARELLASVDVPGVSHAPSPPRAPRAPRAPYVPPVPVDAVLLARVREAIEAEDPAHPLSDGAIVQRLAAAGISAARRTVAKAREQLGIASSSRRRLL
jgi:hypothetical protein